SIIALSLLTGCDVTGTNGDSSPTPRGPTQLGPEPAGGAQVTEYDSAALFRIGQNSLGPVVLSRQAAQKATDPNVKSFAARIQRSHTDLNERMDDLAKERGIKLARDLSDGDTRELNRLKKLTGKEFDKAYVDAMIDNLSLAANTMHEEAKRGS